MKNYFTFEVNGKTKKAFQTLHNLLEIETQTELNLANILKDSMNQFISLSDAFKIMKVAVREDCENNKEALEFCEDFFRNLSKIDAIKQVQAFLLTAFSIPDSQENEKDDDEKK